MAMALPVEIPADPYSKAVAPELTTSACPAVPSVVKPVPPFATASVPARVIVPEEVTGPPDVVNPVVPPDTSTEVTDPCAAASANNVTTPELFSQ